MRSDDEMNDAIGAWHRSDSALELHEWLGLTWAEYASWVERGQTKHCAVPLASPGSLGSKTRSQKAHR